MACLHSYFVILEDPFIPQNPESFLSCAILELWKMYSHDPSAAFTE